MKQYWSSALWNILPKEVMEDPSLGTFTTQLDKTLANIQYGANPALADRRTRSTNRSFIFITSMTHSHGSIECKRSVNEKATAK